MVGKGEWKSAFAAAARSRRPVERARRQIPRHRVKKMYGEFDATQPEAFFACLADFLVDFEQARRDNEESRARAKKRKLNKAKAEAQKRKLEVRKKEREKAKARQKEREDAEDAEDAAAGKQPRRRRRSSIHRAPKPAPSAMAAMINLL